ncbi:MAG: SDR family oxidoreductase [Reichenbachiella sp.]
MFKGQKIIIVGGSSGIGLELAQNLLELNAEVIIASRSSEKLSSATESLDSKVKSFVVDASNENDVIAFFNKIGNFDHLISTIKPKHLTQPFADTNLSEVHDAFNAKYWGQYNLVRQGINFIRPTGSFVLSSGIASKKGYPGFSNTSAMNGAIESLVKSLVTEISPIRINAVCPGFIESQTNDVDRLKKVTSLGARLPLKRLGLQSEVADSIIYLLNNKYSTGTILEIDGGEICA